MNYVTRTRQKGWPGYLNRSMRSWLHRKWLMEVVTNMDPWVWWIGRRLP